MKKVFFYILIAISMLSFQAFAGECVVKNESQFTKSLETVISKGGCSTDSAGYRERYERFRGTSIQFHVIRANGSIDIEGSVPCMMGYNGEPLIIEVPSGESLVYSSTTPLCIEGGGGLVIIDGISILKGGVVIDSSKNVLLNSIISGATVKVNGAANRIIDTEISYSSGNGLELIGNDNVISGSDINDNDGYGILINGSGNRIVESSIANNIKGGVRVNGEPAMISRTSFSGNGGEPISKTVQTITAPKDLVSIDGGGEWIVTGNIDVAKTGINLSAVKIELFYKDGPFIAETDSIDRASGQFTFYLQKPLKVGVREITSPVFMATAVDSENNDTSPFSSPLDPGLQSDWDNDGISNDQEDVNRNGLVDKGETDPRRSDTDGDGLTDGEEKLHTGKVKELLERGYKMNDLSRLDPVLSDSDGDCLSDGLELGVMSVGIMAAQSSSATEVMQAMAGATNSIDSSYIDTLSSYCRAILKAHSVNEVSAYDTEPSSSTDPTNADTDSDGLKDGEEDWNFNGKKDPSETDPNEPDSDGDTLLDGQEGDLNNNGKLDEKETDPILEDTDDDGIGDGIELGRFGTLANSCDSDKDGLPDGIETGIIHPNLEKPECSGLQTAGTNFAAISVLSATNTDSDGDGLLDGFEDANHNGWLDAGETDPTLKDTDDDGISDNIENNLDVDRNEFPDIDISILENGEKCSPPTDAKDLDCDGIVNARDLDSDGDGCSDEDEWEKDKNSDGVPDAWQQSAASCDKPAGSSSGGGSSGSGNGSSSALTGDTSKPAIPASLLPAESADCSLIKGRSQGNGMRVSCFLMLLTLAGICSRRFV